MALLGPVVGQANRVTARPPAVIRKALVVAGVLLVAAAPVPAQATRYTVALSDSAFSPPTVRIMAGDDVFWCPNADNTKTHSVDADDGSFQSLELPPHSGCTWMTFQHDGTFPYHCRFVSGMTGTVIVGNSSAPSPTAAPATTRAPLTATTAKRTTATTTRGVAAASARSTTTAAEQVEATTVPTEAVAETTSTTSAQVAIRETSTSSGGGGRVLLGAMLAVALIVGGGYVFYRGRQPR